MLAGLLVARPANAPEPTLCPPRLPVPLLCAGIWQVEGPSDPSQLLQLNQRIAEQVAALLQATPAKELRALGAERGVALPRGAALRPLLQALLPAIKVRAWRWQYVNVSACPLSVLEKVHAYEGGDCEGFIPGSRTWAPAAL